MGPPKRNCPDVISLLPFMSVLRGPFPKAWAHVPLPCRRNKLRAPRHFPGTQSVPEAPRSNLAPERTWKAGRASASLMPFLPLPVSGRPLNRGPSACRPSESGHTTAQTQGPPWGSRTPAARSSASVRRPRGHQLRWTPRPPGPAADSHVRGPEATWRLCAGGRGSVNPVRARGEPFVYCDIF